MAYNDFYEKNIALNFFIGTLIIVWMFFVLGYAFFMVVFR